MIFFKSNDKVFKETNEFEEENHQLNLAVFNKDFNSYFS